MTLTLPPATAAGQAADQSQSDSKDMNAEKRRELAVFLFLTLVLAPLLAVLVVAGYGFLVWMYQLIAGPPGM